MQRADQLRLSLSQHMRAAGLAFESANKVMKRLRRMMGASRFEAFERVLEGETADRLAAYACLQTAQEVNTAFSMQADVALVVGTWIAQQVAEQRPTGLCIGDLGCGSGVLTGWLAAQHPSCQVVGWDALPSMLQAARSSQKASNLAFEAWTYDGQPCPRPASHDLLVSGMGVDLPRTAVTERVVPPDLRASILYRGVWPILDATLASWRTAARDGALLLTVQRLPSLEAYLAMVDAAHAHGWTLERDRFARISTRDETFPAFTFRARTAPPPTAHEFVRLVFREQVAQHGEVAGRNALRLHDALPDKVPLQEGDTTLPDGRVVHVVVGTSGPYTFKFGYAEGTFAHLRFVAATDAQGHLPEYDPDRAAFGIYT